MGVDAQGVRKVVHMTLPRSLEEYVQQVMHLLTNNIKTRLLCCIVWCWTRSADT